jgi:hypothetical protein
VFVVAYLRVLKEGEGGCWERQVAFSPSFLRFSAK